MKDLVSIVQYCYKIHTLMESSAPPSVGNPPIWIIPHSYKKILIPPLWINFSITILESQSWYINKYVVTRRNNYQAIVASLPNLLYTLLFLSKHYGNLVDYFFLEPPMLFMTGTRNKLWMCISFFTKYGVFVLDCKVINTVNCNWPLLINF